MQVLQTRRQTKWRLKQRRMTKDSLKAVILLRKWGVLAAWFDFEPLFLDKNREVLDYRSCPAAMMKILNRPSNLPPPATEPPASHAVKRHKQSRSRELTFQNQSGICFYCQRPTDYEYWTIDHKVPLSKGGTNHRDNKIGACHACNNAKGGKSLEKFMASDYLARRRAPHTPPGSPAQSFPLPEPARATLNATALHLESAFAGSKTSSHP